MLLQKPLLSIFKQPSKFVDIAEYTKVSKAFLADRRAGDLIELVKENFLEKFDEFPAEILSLIESMNSLKALFQEIKMVPE